MLDSARMATDRDGREGTRTYGDRPMLTRPTPPAALCEPGRLFVGAPDRGVLVNPVDGTSGTFAVSSGEVPYSLVGHARVEPTVDQAFLASVAARAVALAEDWMRANPSKGVPRICIRLPDPGEHHQRVILMADPDRDVGFED